MKPMKLNQALMLVQQVPNGSRHDEPGLIIEEGRWFVWREW